MTCILPVHGGQALWLANMVSTYTKTKMTHALKYFLPLGFLLIDSDLNAILIIIIIPGNIGIIIVTTVTIALVPILTAMFFNYVRIWLDTICIQNV